VGIAKALFVGTTANIAGVATFSAGTVSAPAITTTGDTNTGIFFPAADTIAFTEGGAESMRITSSGNVGIGSLVSYEAKLKVATTNGSADFAASGINICGAAEITSGQVLPISFTPIGNDTTRARAAIGCVVGTNWGFGNLAFYTRAAADASVLTTADERMRIDSSGNVGIGTTAPSQKLEIYAAANSLQIESVVRNDQAGSGVAAIGFNVSSGAAAETSSTKAGIGLVRTNAYGVGALCFYNNGTGSAGNFTTADERMRIDSSGNVGIGTNSNPGTPVAGRLSVLPASNPTTIATSTTLTLGETSNNSAYQLRMAYSFLSSVYTGVIDAVQNSLGAPLAINPTGGGVLINQTSTDGGQLNVTGTTSTTARAFSNATLRNSRVLGTHYGVISWNGKYIADAWIGQTPGSDSLCFGHDAGTTIVESMRLDTGGNLLVGTTTSNSVKFVVDSGASNYSTAFIKNSGAIPDNNDNSALYVLHAGTTGTGLRVRTDQALTGSNFAHIMVNNASASIGGLQVSQYGTGYIASFDKSGTVAMRIDTSGNVGVGTSSPVAKLAVVGGTSNASSLATAYSLAAFNITPKSTSGYSLQFGSGPSDLPYIQMSAGGSSAGDLLIQPYGGNVLVATTNSAPGNGSGNNVSGFAVNTDGTTWASRSGFSALSVNRVDTTGDVLRAASAGTQVGGISVTSSATAFNTSSDYRLKQDIAPMTGALIKVAALKPVTYKWKRDGSDGEGFIAHELAEVCPQAVTGDKDAVDADGNPIHQGIDTSFLVATLTAAIQEQQALITSLTARIVALESN